MFSSCNIDPYINFERRMDTESGDASEREREKTQNTRLNYVTLVDTKHGYANYFILMNRNASKKVRQDMLT